jgi:hypothetical protein
MDLGCNILSNSMRNTLPNQEPTPGNDAANSAFAKIPVRSHQQAMDWSLVLVSQGIETAIEQSADGGSWALVTSRTDHGAALRTLRQYGLENKGWPWRQTLPWTRTHFDWGSLAWVGLLIFFYWFTDVTAGLRVSGVMDSTAVLSGQWWRVFTAMTLHGDLGASCGESGDWCGVARAGDGTIWNGHGTSGGLSGRSGWECGFAGFEYEAVLWAWRVGNGDGGIGAVVSAGVRRKQK